MTAFGGRSVQCSTAAQTGGSICPNTKNYCRDRIEAQAFGGLGGLLNTCGATKLFQMAYAKEIAAANKMLASQQNALNDELVRIGQEIGNLVVAIGREYDSPSIKAKLDGLEGRRAEIQAQSAKPAPDVIAPNPKAESLWQAKMLTLSANLRDGPEGQPFREALRGLIERVTLAPDQTAVHGFMTEVEGALAALLDR